MSCIRVQKVLDRIVGARRLLEQILTEDEYNQLICIADDIADSQS